MAIYRGIMARHSFCVNDTTYNDENDDPQIYAVPMYLKTATPINPSGDKSAVDNRVYYVLELSWNETDKGENFTQWNKAENNKETDNIFITASRSTG